MRYTIKSESPEGTYYLINGWNKYQVFWEKAELLKPEKLFSKIGTAKASLNKLLQTMGDYYLEDKFSIVEFDDAGNITKLKRLSIIASKSNEWGKYDITIKEV